MTAKDKALELYNMFRNTMTVTTANYRAKKQALICVNEIIKTIQPHLSITWWQDVKQEINKL